MSRLSIRGAWHSRRRGDSLARVGGVVSACGSEAAAIGALWQPRLGLVFVSMCLPCGGG